MKKLFLLLLLPFAVLANPIDDKCPQFVFNGAPVSKLTETQYLCKKNYAIHYRYNTKTAEYVVEHITLANITGPAKRKDDFRPDLELPEKHRSVLSDYAGQPYDRGHLSPGADNNANDIFMSESFFLSNMVPQVPNHNRGIWKQLETAVRSWVREGKDIYVVSGTTYSAEYLKIGKGEVGVPTGLWKVIIDAKTNKAIAFDFPNAPLPVKDLPKYATTVRAIEQKTGLNFHPKLKDDTVETAVPNLTEWSGVQ